MTTAAWGIMGGTFDPIHLGHLAAAESVRHDFGLEKVIFIPSGRPPHKMDGGATPPEHRYRMCLLATQDNPRFEVSDLELKRPGPSYTIQTVSELRGLYPDVELFFITGFDAILEIVTWKDYSTLLQQCSFIAVTRPGFSIKQLDELKGRLGSELALRINMAEVPAVAISSTDIRRRVRAGKPIRYLVPEAVENYIRVNNLYIG